MHQFVHKLASNAVGASLVNIKCLLLFMFYVFFENLFSGKWEVRSQRKGNGLDSTVDINDADSLTARFFKIDQSSSPQV